MRRISLTIASVVGSLFVASAANAAVVVTVGAAGAGTSTGMNFNSIPATTAGNAPSSFTIGDWTFTNGTQPVQVNIGTSGSGAQPYQTTGNYLSVLGGGTENVSFSARSSFSFFWGSIDDFNTIVVHTTAGNQTYTGADMASMFSGQGVQATGCQVQTACNRYFTFTDSTDAITGFSISSSSNSFELTNISAVPEPTTWAMMILGFLGLGFLGYRKSARSAGGAFRIA